MERLDVLLKSAFAAAGGTAAFLFGGWPALLQVLLIIVAIDYVTGVMAAGAEGRLRSSIGLMGIARKVFIFFVVAVAHQVDSVLGDQHLLRDATIFFYLANELLSIIENGGRLGVPLPPVIKQAVEVLRGKGEIRDKNQ
ncbi:MAG: phage holin family protein [Paenibacillus dendritiformis]|uniref:phage holin family protein n=1 Tax=Paenibacillus dendritiformis TaxID=130049 RepID=UPI00143DB9C7|nr:phage holin family protein [Paenibacillus dendritiformis]MBG9794467.1 holin [Paenibacillus dendritiformis]MDU5142431.1 phage holin family protein [Paenibacillus dendritiformis]NKI23258.1 phage holin family protein [Paenibacillus dendritiformis]NRF98021.1 phage holin family protein [Paenibacillus dendritiformis]